MAKQKPRERPGKANSKKKLINYSEEALQMALCAVREQNIGIRQASRQFGVPRSTIQDRIQGRTTDKLKKTGPPPILTIEGEKKIAQWIINIAKCGFPIKKSDLLETIIDASTIILADGLLSEEISTYQETMEYEVINSTHTDQVPQQKLSESFDVIDPIPADEQIEPNVNEIERSRKQISRNEIPLSDLPVQENNTSIDCIESTDPFELHLSYPEPIENAKIKTQKQKLPSAISCETWRNHYRTSDQLKYNKLEKAKQKRYERLEKKRELEEIKKRKLNTMKRKRQLAKMKRINVKGKKSQKENLPTQPRKIPCSSCEEDLQSDAEEDGEKNIGCDICPRWYHLKCTLFRDLTYQEAATKDYTCDICVAT